MSHCGKKKRKLFAPSARAALLALTLASCADLESQDPELADAELSGDLEGDEGMDVRSKSGPDMAVVFSELKVKWLDGKTRTLTYKLRKALNHNWEAQVGGKFVRLAAVGKPVTLKTGDIYLKNGKTWWFVQVTCDNQRREGKVPFDDAFLKLQYQCSMHQPK